MNISLIVDQVISNAFSPSNPSYFYCKMIIDRNAGWHLVKMTYVASGRRDFIVGNFYFGDVTPGVQTVPISQITHDMRFNHERLV